MVWSKKIQVRVWEALLVGGLFLMMVSIPVAAEAPVANFTGTPLAGPAPLMVNFTDLTTNSPVSWAWFFGDETYAGPWMQMSVSSGWSDRMGTSLVAMPGGGLILIGGYSGSYSNRVGVSSSNSAPWLQLVATPGPSSTNQLNTAVSDNYVAIVGGYNGGYDNDVWKSADDGATWTLLTVSPPWSARAGQSVVILPDGRILLMGGYTSIGVYNNDVWQSMDGGNSWSLVTVSPGWSPRSGQSTVVMPDGSIVLLAGGGASQVNNDVWKSSDGGVTWTLETASPGWSARTGQNAVATTDGSIVLMGGWSQYGQYKNDVWRSTDDGATWVLETVNPGWSARAGMASVAMPDGSIILTGGCGGSSSYQGDVWRSTDDGASWTQLTVNPGWSARAGQGIAVTPAGTVIVAAGWGGSENGDVWSLPAAGSLIPDPAHQYAKPGVYSVALETSNPSGSSTMVQNAYVNVTVPNKVVQSSENRTLLASSAAPPVLTQTPVPQITPSTTPVTVVPSSVPYTTKSPVSDGIPLFALLVVFAAVVTIRRR